MKFLTKLFVLLILLVPNLSWAMIPSDDEDKSPTISYKKQKFSSAKSKKVSSSSSDDEVYSSPEEAEVPQIIPVHNHNCECHDCEETRKSFVSTKPGSGKWKDTITPKRGWICKKVEDLGDASLTCQMCERETIRYTHTMQHVGHKDLIVGCICAGHMEENLEAAETRDAYLKSRVQRRQNWLSLKWKTSRGKGNPHIKTRKNDHENGYHVIITNSNKFGKLQYSASIDGAYLGTWFDSMNEAKYAAFDYLWPASKAF